MTAISIYGRIHRPIVVAASRDFLASDWGATLQCTNGPTLTSMIASAYPPNWWCILHDVDGLGFTVAEDAGPTMAILSKATIAAGPPRSVSSTLTALDEAVVKLRASGTDMVILGDLA